MNNALQKITYLGLSTAPFYAVSEAARALFERMVLIARQPRDVCQARNDLARRTVELDKWEARLAVRETFLEEREAYVESCENRLSERAAEIILQEAELEHARS